MLKFKYNFLARYWPIPLTKFQQHTVSTKILRIRLLLLSKKEVLLTAIRLYTQQCSG